MFAGSNSTQGAISCDKNGIKHRHLFCWQLETSGIETGVFFKNLSYLFSLCNAVLSRTQKVTRKATAEPQYIRDKTEHMW